MRWVPWPQRGHRLDFENPIIGQYHVTGPVRVKR
jgi:hypothetical protein